MKDNNNATKKFDDKETENMSEEPTMKFKNAIDSTYIIEKLPMFAFIVPAIAIMIGLLGFSLEFEPHSIRFTSFFTPDDVFNYAITYAPIIFLVLYILAILLAVYKLLTQKLKSRFLKTLLSPLFFSAAVITPIASINYFGPIDWYYPLLQANPAEKYLLSNKYNSHSHKNEEIKRSLIQTHNELEAHLRIGDPINIFTKDKDSQKKNYSEYLCPLILDHKNQKGLWIYDSCDNDIQLEFLFESNLYSYSPLSYDKFRGIIESRNECTSLGVSLYDALAEYSIVDKNNFDNAEKALMRKVSRIKNIKGCKNYLESHTTLAKNHFSCANSFYSDKDSFEDCITPYRKAAKLQAKGSEGPGQTGEF